MNSSGKEQSSELRRELNKRLATMIPLGATIGTGIFLSSGFAVNTAGPAGAIIAYSIVILMIYFVMTALTEMAAHLPVSGSFESYASLYVDPAFGFTIGWNYWLSWAISLGVEVVAAGLLMQYWFKDIPVVWWSALFLIILTVLNFFAVRSFGETEFWFAGIKVAMIIIFLIIGALMIIGVLGGHAVGLSNYIHPVGGTPFHQGIKGIALISMSAAFALLGMEGLGTTAGESIDPAVTIPKANKSLVWQVVLCYIGAMFVIGAIIPWQQAAVNTSPLTVIFKKAGIPYAADLINFVMVTAVLSAGNSGLYSAARVLYGMAKEGKAPRVLAVVDKRGVPIYAIVVTAIIGGVGLFSQIYSPEKLYIWLISLAGLPGLFVWLFISITHLRFRQLYIKEHGSTEGLKYLAPWYPVGSIIAIIICGFVTIGQFFDPAMRLSVYLGVPFFFGLYAIYKVVRKTKLVRAGEGKTKITSLADLEKYQNAFSM